MTSTTPNSNPRRLIESLIASISTSSTTNPSSSSTTTTTTTSNNQNPLKSLSQSSKTTFLTLYALFETTLLPALDCLDRGLITRLILSEKNQSAVQRDLYLVRSAQQQQHHHHHPKSGTTTTTSSQPEKFYEVRLKSWNCSCPAFCFAAFPALTHSNSTVQQQKLNHNSKLEEEEKPDLFGGLTTRSENLPPVCKHLLACVLVRDVEVLKGYVLEREVSREEVAGWGAGWGD